MCEEEKGGSGEGGITRTMHMGERTRNMREDAQQSMGGEGTEAAPSDAAL